MNKRGFIRYIVCGLFGLLIGCGEEVGDETGTALVRFLLKDSLTQRWEALGDQLVIYQCDESNGTCVTEDVCGSECNCNHIPNQIEGSPFQIPLNRDSKLERINIEDRVLTRFAARLMNSRCASIASGMTEPLQINRGDIIPLSIQLNSTSTIQIPVNLEESNNSESCQVVNEPESPIHQLEVCIPNEIRASEAIHIEILELYNGPEISQLTQAGVFVEIGLEPEPEIISPPISLRFPFDPRRVEQLDIDDPASLKLFRFNSSARQWAPLPNQTNHAIAFH